jgi:tetraacyldisaccharide 4'-kinase
VNATTFLLLPFSWLFGVGVALRNKCFDWGIFRSESLGVPTISVGNLTVGGTGKTPVVASIARYLRQKGKRVAILSRGYKRESTGFVLVSDGEKVLVGATLGGDEPQELAQQLHGVVVAVDQKRARAGRKALERFSIDVLILDDGFQHRAVKRDVDIVTIPMSSGQTPRFSGTASEFLIPAGERREPLRSLKRANLLVFTRARDVGSSTHAFEEMKKGYRRFTSADASAVDFQVRTLMRLSDREEEHPRRFVGKNAFLFCGIADHESFFRLASDSGLEVVRTQSFSDHYRYRAQDLLSLGNQFAASGAELLLTTMKDAARLSDFQEGKVFLREFPVYGLAVEVEFLHGEKEFYRNLDRLFA